MGVGVNCQGNAGECSGMPGEGIGGCANCMGNAGECQGMEVGAKCLGNVRQFRGMPGNLWEWVQSTRGMQENVWGVGAKCQKNAV